MHEHGGLGDGTKYVEGTSERDANEEGQNQCRPRGEELGELRRGKALRLVSEIRKKGGK
jgi:hypothetical protein